MRLVQLVGSKGDVLVINPERVEVLAQESEGLVRVCFMSQKAVTVQGTLMDIADKLGRVVLSRET